MEKAKTVTVAIKAPPLTRLVKEHWEVSPLKVTFAASAVPLSLVNKEVVEGITITPAIEGSWKWVRDVELQFIPKDDWPVGQVYEVEIAKRGLVAPHVRLEQYRLTFTTAPFAANFAKAEFYQDPVDPKLKKVVATVNFSHPVDEATVARRVGMQFRTKGALRVANYSPRITFDKDRLNAIIHSDPLEIPQKDVVMHLVVTPGVRAAKGGPPLANALQKDVTIPGLYSLLQIDSAW